MSISPATGRPGDAKALFEQAIALCQAGRFAEADRTIRRILQIEPRHCDALHLLGMVCSQLGNHAEALVHFDAASRIDAKSADVYNSRGNVLAALKRFDEALASFETAIALDAGSALAISNRGNAQRDLGQFEAALASYDRAIALDPDDAETYYSRGSALQELGRLDEAVASYDEAIALRPEHAEAFSNRGVALLELTRLGEAVESFDRAIALKPNFPEAWNNRGNAFQEMKRLDEALASYDRAAAIKPDFAEAWTNRGAALQELKRFEAAVASCRRALAVNPHSVEARISLGDALQSLARHEEALVQYDMVLTSQPNRVDALVRRGNALEWLRRNGEALASYERAASLDPDNPHACSGLALSALADCDWPRMTKLAPELEARVQAGKFVVMPFTFLGYCSDPALQLACARAFVAHKVPARPPPLWTGTVWQNPKIRIAYFGSGFHEHPLAYLTAELFEIHDRSRFEVLGISVGPDDRSGVRARLVRAFDQFHDVRATSDRDVARLIDDLKVDIVIDRSGHSTDGRPQILAYRPAPIQVNYLGYPGTMGAEFYDYLIADPIVLPFDQQRFVVERIVHLPECYQSNDAKRVIAKIPTRQEVGLPDQGFVFCCFNNNTKITAPMFDIWMRLLHRVEGSVLWLLRTNAVAEDNLRKEARARGIDAARLVFAERVKLEQHLARHRLADLFLDTLPYNAHTTASDALWSGLPLVTCYGESFPGRVAASLVRAVGLPELVTRSLEEYETLALRLATDTSLLRRFRERLEQNRLVYPLFDTDRYRRHIETAYAKMWELWQCGEQPRSFNVEPLPIES